MFSTHLDCVPPYVPLSEDAEAIRGRGSCDAKGLAAAMVAAAERLAERGERRIGLLFLVGEENGSDGAQAPPTSSPRAGSSSTASRPRTGSRSDRRARSGWTSRAAGRAAHSAYPEEGESAIAALLDTIERIRRLPLPTDPLLGASTLNVGIISGGVAPERHGARGRRADPVPDRRADRWRSRRAIRGAGRAGGLDRASRSSCRSIKAGPRRPGWDTTVVSYASDLPFLTTWGEGYQLGPGTIRVAHTADEHIRKADLLRGVDLYVRLATDLLAREASS